MEEESEKADEVPEEVVRVVEVGNSCDPPIKLTPTGKISHAKTRVYTQRYRKEWEQMSEFKEWLTSVPDEVTRAYCRFCSRNLHAHRLSLLKHMCTLKHQRAAVQYSKHQTHRTVKLASNMFREDDSCDNFIYHSEDENEEMIEETLQEDASDSEIGEIRITEPNPSDKVKEDTLSKAMANVITESNDIHLEMVVDSENEENDENNSHIYEIQQLKNLPDDSQSLDERSQEIVNKNENTKPIIVSECNNFTFDSKKVVLVSSLNGKSYTLLKSSFIPKTGTSPVPKLQAIKLVTEVNSITTTTPTTTKTNVSRIPNKTPVSKNVKSLACKSPMVSTHIFDTSKGMSVSGLQVILYKLTDGKWSFVHESITSADGTCKDFLKILIPGRYKFHYDIEKYYNAKKIATSFPFIEIVFDIKDPQKTYHIPLHVSPYAYSTHRDILK